MSDELWPRDWHLRIMGFMRKALMLTVYLAMIAAGSWVTYDWVVFGGREFCSEPVVFLPSSGPIFCGSTFCRQIGNSFDPPQTP
jgi:hypothetical protein